MGHIAYGYSIKKGQLGVDDAAADRVKILFNAYLAGASLIKAAGEAGIKKQHSAISSMLSDRKYLGDSYYPPIIDSELFERVQAERQRRIVLHTKRHGTKPEKKKAKSVVFSIPDISLQFTDPFRQAEYAYSLIESEVKSFEQ